MIDKKLLYLTNELTALENQYVFALNAAGVGIWTWDIKKNELTWDSRMLKIFDVEKNGFINDIEFFRNIVVAEDRNAVVNAIHECVERGIPYDISFRIRDSKGYIRVVRGKGQVMRGVDGEATIMAGICFEESPACPRYANCEIRQAIEKGDMSQVERYILAIKSATMPVDKPKTTC